LGFPRFEGLLNQRLADYLDQVGRLFPFKGGTKRELVNF
jgi:hypothetical protein